jgi:hypothetical protein
MAYLHCHTPKCGWEQDDFWSWKYNPVTKIWNDITWLIRPRIIELDEWIIDDITKYTYVPVRRFVAQKGQFRVHSWNWLLVEIVKDIKIAAQQKWWTWKSWERAWTKKIKPVCPRCGKQCFDID